MKTLCNNKANLKTVNNKTLALLEQLKNSFVQSVPEKLDEIESYILNLSNTDSIEENFENLYRSIHSLKGAGGTYGFTAITTICHLMTPPSHPPK